MARVQIAARRTHRISIRTRFPCTPRDTILRINSEVARAIKESDARERFYSIGTEPPANTPEEFAALIQTEMMKWAKVVKAAGIKVE